MTELSSADFCKLTIQEAADMLLEKLDDQETSTCKLYGCSEDKMFELELKMKEVEHNE